MSIADIIRIIDKTLYDMYYVESFYRIFGVREAEAQDHFKFTRYLLQEREQYRNIIKEGKRSRRRAIVANEDEILRNLKRSLAVAERNKLLWKTRPLKVLCSDQKLLALGKVVEQDGFVCLSKNDAEKLFGFTPAVPFWNSVPSYTGIVLGDGLALVSPEYDLFRSMCWFSDEATRTQHQLDVFDKETDYHPIDEREYVMIRSLNRTMCVYTVISSFLVVEAYLNSLAHLCLSDRSRHLSEEERLFLSERSRGKDGKGRQKFVAIQDKLYEWVKIISPRGETFEKGGKLFQDFMKLKSYRDSIVHLSERKVQAFNSISFKIAVASVQTVVKVIQTVDQCVAQGPEGPQQTWWLTTPGSDGYFHLPEKVDLPSPPKEESFRL
jgi:hypothetical protein